MHSWMGRLTILQKSILPNLILIIMIPLTWMLRLLPGHFEVLQLLNQQGRKRLHSEGLHGQHYFLISCCLHTIESCLCNLGDLTGCFFLSLHLPGNVMEDQHYPQGQTPSGFRPFRKVISPQNPSKTFHCILDEM